MSTPFLWGIQPLYTIFLEFSTNFWYNSNTKITKFLENGVRGADCNSSSFFIFIPSLSLSFTPKINLNNFNNKNIIEIYKKLLKHVLKALNVKFALLKIEYFFFFEILQHNFSRQRDLSIPKNFVSKFLPSARGLHKFLWTVCYCVVVKIKKKKNHKEGFIWLKV